MVDGKPKYEHQDRREAFLRGIAKKPNVRYAETHEKYVAKRSLAQNAYYFGVVVSDIVKETGSDKDSVHYELRKKFLLIKDGIIPKVGSTKDLSTIKFNEYINKCILWAGEFLHMTFDEPYYPDDLLR